MKHTACNPVRSASDGLYICLTCRRVYREVRVIGGKVRFEEVEYVAKRKAVKR